MKRLLAFALPVLFIAVLIVDIAARAEAIIGEITSIGDGVVRLREDRTQAEYQLMAPPANIANLRIGYRVEVNSTGGRVSSLTVLGMPMRAQSEVFQKFKSVTYPQQ